MRIGWLNVVRRPGRLLTTGLAFALAVLAMVLFQGFSDGLYSTYTALVRNTPVDLWVAEQGIRSPANTFSLVPRSLEQEIAALPGVQSVTPLFAVPVMAEARAGKLPLMLYGYDRSTGLGGPWRMAAGTPPAGQGEIVLDQAFAGQNGIRVGDPFSLLGREFRISGLSAGTNSFMYVSAFADLAEVGRLIGAPDRASFLLVRLQAGADPDKVMSLIPPGYAVYAREQFRDSSAETLERTMGPPLRLLLMVSFLVGLAVIALTTYAGVLERREEYGVLRAVGMPPAALAATLSTEVLISAAAGIALGLVLAAVVAVALGRALPSYPVVLTAGGLARTALLGLAMGLVAALAPLWRISRMDPAGVFRV